MACRATSLDAKASLFLLFLCNVFVFLFVCIYFVSLALCLWVGLCLLFWFLLVNKSVVFPAVLVVWGVMFVQTCFSVMFSTTVLLFLFGLLLLEGAHPLGTANQRWV